ncbi:MAG TPA: 1,4-dihydroxy-2-naphthoate polyprenyltransferase [Opitutaceae bacterium]|nr:1,4-dihydroxy-2-naphthoate polyprenyltransferase [Opitutaceae bacterium]
MSLAAEPFRLSALRIWVSASRPRTLPAAVAPVVVGSAMAARDHRFDPAAAGICLAFALLVQVGTNFANDYYDFVHGADTAARVGPRRAVASGLVPPAAMRSAMAAVFGAAFAVGLALLRWGGPWMLAVGAASILCGIAYTGGPWPLGYHGFGDALVFVFFGPVAVTITYFVQTGRITPYAVLAGVPMGLLAANILLVNNYRDADTDAAAGKRTLVVRFGRRVARAQHAVSLCIALAVPAAYWAAGFGAWSLLPLLTAPLAWSHIRRMAAGKAPSDYVALLGDSGRFIALYAALFAAGVLI